MRPDQQKRAKVIVQDGLPSAADFTAKRAACGWGAIPVRQAEHALRNSLYGAVAKAGGKTIGFVRVIGDGVLNLYIQDLIVDEAWRELGLGGQLMRHVMSRIERESADCITIGLMAAEGKEAFYEGFGFTKRPTNGYGAGMTKFL